VWRSWGGDGAWREGEVAGISGPKVHSEWVTPEILGVAFKFCSVLACDWSFWHIMDAHLYLLVLVLLNHIYIG